MDTRRRNTQLGLVTFNGPRHSEDGSLPYPAAGVPANTAEEVPPFPAQGQIALQVPTEQPNFGAKSIEVLPRGSGELNFTLNPDQ